MITSAWVEKRASTKLATGQGIPSWAHAMVTPPKTKTGRVLQQKWASSKLRGGAALEKRAGFWQDLGRSMWGGPAPEQTPEQPAPPTAEEVAAQEAQAAQAAKDKSIAEYDQQVSAIGPGTGEVPAWQRLRDAHAEAQRPAAPVPQEGQTQAQANAIASVSPQLQARIQAERERAKRVAGEQAQASEFEQRRGQGLPTVRNADGSYMTLDQEDQVFNQVHQAQTTPGYQEGDGVGGNEQGYRGFKDMDTATRRRYLAYQREQLANRRDSSAATASARLAEINKKRELYDEQQAGSAAAQQQRINQIQDPNMRYRMQQGHDKAQAAEQQRAQQWAASSSNPANQDKSHSNFARQQIGRIDQANASALANTSNRVRRDAQEMLKNPATYNSERETNLLTRQVNDATNSGNQARDILAGRNKTPNPSVPTAGYQANQNSAVSKLPKPAVGPPPKSINSPAPASTNRTAAPKSGIMSA